MNCAKVITLKGTRPGKTLTIMAGVHGDEICGVKALDAFILKPTIEAGHVHCIYGNPRAIEREKQQVEMNLNRAFRSEEEVTEAEKKTYERARALELMPYLRESAALLDIHSSDTKVSPPFIIAEPRSFFIARRLPFPIRSHGWDAIEPGGTDYFVNKCGGYGLCVECGYNLDPAAPGRAETAIKIFLSLMGAVSGFISVAYPGQREMHAHSLYRTKVNFIPEREFADFEELGSGEVIGYDAGEAVRAPVGVRSFIVFCATRDAPGEEGFILVREIVSWST